MHSDKITESKGRRQAGEDSIHIENIDLEEANTKTEDGAAQRIAAAYGQLEKDVRGKVNEIFHQWIERCS